MSENKQKAHIVSRLPQWLRSALFALLQWTWGLPQNLAGLAVLLILGKQERYRYHGALITLFDKNRIFGQNGAFSLGSFIFIPRSWNRDFSRGIAVHEYGHTVQSMLLGPLYLPAVGVPSVIWAAVWSHRQRRAEPADGCKKAARSPRRAKCARYTSKYPENWANALGKYATGETPPEH